MESGIQSSFIPHDAGVAIAPRQSGAGSKGLSELALLIAIVLFVSSAALAAAVFLYDQYVQSSAASKLDQLKRAKAAFEPSLIQQLTRLDDRMNAAEQVLVAHIAPSAFFDALQQSTLTTVSFSTLNLDITDSQHMNLKMTGVAQSVNSIALQADLFSKSGVIESPIFSDITREKDGVHFTVAAVLNPAAISYEHEVAVAQGGAAGPSLPQSPATPDQGAQTQQTSPAASSVPVQSPSQPQPQQQPNTAPAQQSTQQPTPSSGSGPYMPKAQ